MFQQAKYSRTDAEDFPNPKARSKFLKAVENSILDYEDQWKLQRERYESAIVTLHAKVASLKSSLELEQTTNKRQREIIESFQQSSHNSTTEQDEMANTIENLKKQVLALRFQMSQAKQVIINSSKATATKQGALTENENGTENLDPNVINLELLSGNYSLFDMKMLNEGKNGSNTYNFPLPLNNFLQSVKTGNKDEIEKMLYISSDSKNSINTDMNKAVNDILGVALGNAILSRQNDIGFLLIERGANVVVRSSHLKNITPLHLICQIGVESLLEFLLEKSSNKVRRTVKGAINEVDEETGSTPLHFAAKGGHSKCVRLLLRHGANAVCQNPAGKTPYEVAVNTMEKLEGNTLGNNNVSSEDIEEVIAILSDKAQLFWAHSVRANRLYGQENFREALDAYNAAIDVSQSNLEREQENDANVASQANKATLYYNSARAAVKLGLDMEGIRRCTKAIDIRNGDYPNALAQRAACYMSIFDFPHAISDYESLSKAAEKKTKLSPSGVNADDWEAHLERARETQKKYSDHYFVLGVSAEAQSTEIRKAFRKQCLKWHPDKHMGNEDDRERASFMFKAINEANEVLRNEQKRTLFDIDRISRRMDDIVRRQNEEQKQWQSQQVNQDQERRNFRTRYGSPQEEASPIRRTREDVFSDLRSRRMHAHSYPETRNKKPSKGYERYYHDDEENSQDSLSDDDIDLNGVDLDATSIQSDSSSDDDSYGERKYPDTYLRHGTAAGYY